MSAARRKPMSEEERVRRLDRQRAKRLANPEAIRSYYRAYTRTDEHRARARQYQARRFFWGRSVRLKGEGRANYVALAALWKRQRGCCALTGERLGRDAHLDHKTARRRGGGDEIANLRWVSAKVNMAKRELSDAEFFDLCAAVIRGSARGDLIDELKP